MDDETVRKAVKESVAALQTNVFGRVVSMTDDDLAAMLQEVQQVYADEAKAKTLLVEVQAMYKK